MVRVRAAYDVACARSASRPERWPRVRVEEDRFSGGFPCRFTGCRACFVVLEGGSMLALNAASARRTKHEIAVHRYRHQRLENHMRRQWLNGAARASRPH